MKTCWCRQRPVAASGIASQRLKSYSYSANGKDIMIVVQIHSGLGNQLFMYAAARALAHKRNTGLYLDVDTDCRNGVNMGEDVGHSFQLDKFNISADYPGLSVLRGQQAPSRVGLYTALKARMRENDALRKIVRLLRRNGFDVANTVMKLSGNDKQFFREERGDWGYKQHFLELPDDTILRGCFFSYKYFDWIRDLIQSELTLKADLSPQSKAVEAQIMQSESVSLHIRRGDVVTNPEYKSWYEGLVTENYYRSAIEYFTRHLGDPHFFVFSDEIEWAKSHFRIPGKVTYVDHNGPAKGYEDLHLMSRCKHNLTTGFSSFSWWAAYLNRNPNKIVLRTRRMNSLDHLNHPEDFFPEGWIVIDS